MVARDSAHLDTLRVAQSEAEDQLLAVGRRSPERKSLRQKASQQHVPSAQTRWQAQISEHEYLQASALLKAHQQLLDAAMTAVKEAVVEEVEAELQPENLDRDCVQIAGTETLSEDPNRSLSPLALRNRQVYELQKQLLSCPKKKQAAIKQELMKLENDITAFRQGQHLKSRDILTKHQHENNDVSMTAVALHVDSSWYLPVHLSKIRDHVCKLRMLNCAQGRGSAVSRGHRGSMAFGCPRLGCSGAYA